MHSPVSLNRSGAIAIICIDHPPVNASSQAVRAGLIQCFATVAADTTFSAVVVHGAGKNFMAGADIAEFDLAGIPVPDPNDVHDAIEALDRPVIAALHGAVLGGGLELALSCHYRIALESASLGLPEVRLGVLPGSGGTQRLPRLAGVTQSLEMMVSGMPVDAATALQLGLLDEVVQDRLLPQALARANRLVHERRPLRIVSRLQLDAGSVRPGLFADYRRELPAADKGGQAARKIVDCVEAATRLPFAEGLTVERQAFDSCKDSDESRALRHLFFAERAAARIPGLSSGSVLRTIRHVGIIGAGTMGGGIAMNFANAGIAVTLVDVSQNALDRGLQIIRKNYLASAAKGRISVVRVEKNMAMIKGTLRDDDVASCDLVIEAAFENLEVKKAICARLGAACKPDAIIATNTSTLDVDVLAEASGRLRDVLGMHFFSPANVMTLLEVVRGARTDPHVLATVMALAKQIGKVAVVSGVCYGFIGNRMLEPYLRETELLLMEGAEPAQIDAAIEAFGFAMGPCRMIDMAGVDVAAQVLLERRKEGFYAGDPAYRAVVRKLHELGWHGQKTGQGYYRYEGRTPIPDERVTQLARALGSQHGIPRRDDISDVEIVERCIYPLMNEGQKILDEGIAYRAGDIDVVWVRGYGFPAYRGGPMHLAGNLGAEHLRRRLAFYATRQGGDPHGYWQPGGAS
jgi:3-hydroxyacyl-CoA dehydrogenase